MNKPALLLALPLLVAATAAQTSPAPASSPAPQFRIDAVGPDGWRVKMGPTNLGSLLESERGRMLWEPRVMPLLGMWKQLVGGEEAFNASRERLLGYGGSIRIGVWLSPAENLRREKATHVAIVVDSDGRTDLTALARDLRLVQDQLVQGQWEERDVAGSKLTVQQSSDATMCAPVREGDHILIAIATNDDLAGAVQRARLLAKDATGKPPPLNAPAMRMQIDMPSIVAMGLDGEDQEQVAMRKLGLPSLGTGSATIGTAGPHVQMELKQQFTSDERGVFGAFFPATATLPRLLNAIPTGKESWKAGRFDWTALYHAVEQVAVTLRSDSDPAKFRAEIKEELGFDLLDDVLAHLTDEALLTTAIEEQIDADTAWSLTLGLRNEATFQKNFRNLLGKAKPFLTREAEGKHGDIPVYRYGSMLGLDLWLAVGNGVLTIGGGREAESLIGTMLDRSKALPPERATDESAATALPKGFSDLQRFLPPGHNGLGSGNVVSVVGMPLDWWYDAVGMLVQLPRQGGKADEQQQQDALALLREHKLDVLRSATGFAERTWRLRMFW